MIKPGVYQHWKGKYYTVTGINTFCENGSILNGTILVEYKDSEGNRYSRSFDQFTEVIKNPSGELVERFKFVKYEELKPSGR